MAIQTCTHSPIRSTAYLGFVSAPCRVWGLFRLGSRTAHHFGAHREGLESRLRLQLPQALHPCSLGRFIDWPHRTYDEHLLLSISTLRLRFLHHFITLIAFRRIYLPCYTRADFCSRRTGSRDHCPLPPPFLAFATSCPAICFVPCPLRHSSLPPICFIAAPTLLSPATSSHQH